MGRKKQIRKGEPPPAATCARVGHPSGGGSRVKLLSYQGGQDVRQGDRITYQGEPGEVEFVITEKAGDPALDWYVDQYPGGG